MDSLDFDVHVSWSGTGRQRGGQIDGDNLVLKLSTPESMSGPGAGTKLYVSAVSAWYAETLFRVLERAGLPVMSLRVAVTGRLRGFPNRTRVAQVAFSPAIVGGDLHRLDEYDQAAQSARERCVIGGRFGPGVVYQVGPVRILGPADETELIQVHKPAATASLR
jgi:organic hydroperoxide reductase OsmC/OhrA